jgi:hypothetical protein
MASSSAEGRLVPLLAVAAVLHRHKSRKLQVKDD